MSRTEENIPDSEKLDIVYQYVLKKHKQEIKEAIWKWTMRAIIILSLASLYFSMGDLLKGSAHPGAGSNAGGSATQTLSKAIGEIIRPIATDIAKDTAKNMMPEGVPLPQGGR